LTATFLSGKTRAIGFRKEQIKKLGFLVQDNEDRFAEALEKDLGRPKGETLFGETSVMKVSQTCDLGSDRQNEVLNWLLIARQAHVNETYSSLDGWAKPQGVKGGFLWMAAAPRTVPVPKGTTLVVSPWNFPISLALGPVLASIAAGNTVILKPAEQTPNLSNLLAELFPQYLDPSAYRVVLGAVDEVTRLLQLPLDHIFFTGAGRVGKIVAHAAVEQSCPFTLELGGKSPALVFADCDFYKTARRLMWGKWTNSGQICIAPDFALCDSAETEAKLVEAIKQVIAEFEGDKGPAIDGPDYTSIINKAHYARVAKLIDETKGTIVINGGRNEPKLKIGTTVVTNVKEDDILMEGKLAAVRDAERGCMLTGGLPCSCRRDFRSRVPCAGED